MLVEKSSELQDLFVLPLDQTLEAHLAGGKAINLAAMIRAGWPVPEGFVVTTSAFHLARQAGPDEMPAEIAQAITEAYRRIGSPVVAVRSSATAEDLAHASMAGQYDTFLDIKGEDDVVAAVQRCWASLNGTRILSYLKEHHIDPASVAMAVVVQRLVAADVAGVFFTANPKTGSPRQMLIEASWGLGESVVSGLVQPDELVIDAETGAVLKANIAEKKMLIAAGSHAQQAVPENRRRIACLNSQQVHELWKLGKLVQKHFGRPQDIEWAIEGDKLFLLQSRAVTTLGDLQAATELIERTRERLQGQCTEGRGAWVRHNLSETLPLPTPLTWSIICPFMSGSGGFGRMYQQVGFEPDQQAKNEGFLELIAGRIYMDLSRAGGMFFANFPFRYDLDLLARNPDAAQGPPTVPNGSIKQMWQAGRKLGGLNARLEMLAADDDRQFTSSLVPAFISYVKAEKARDLVGLSSTQWLEAWEERRAKVLDEFAPQSLLPSLIAAMAMEHLRAFLDEHCWDEDPQEIAGSLAGGAEPDLTMQSTVGLYQVGMEQRTLADWLETFGHRAPDEFDLASPRWREQPRQVLDLARQLKEGTPPAQVHHKRVEQSAQRLKDLRQKLSPADQTKLQEHLNLAHRYLKFREDGKYYLMLGYDLLRDMALDAGRRLGISHDVFLLEFAELRHSLQTGFAPLELIDRRRQQRRAASRVVLPNLIRPGEIATIGEPPALTGAARHTAFAISPGHGSGPVRIRHAPQDAGDLGEDYILVCPSTDPSWTPLFVNARALVLECGGALSHGAVVAREMGIPAVVLENATRLFAEGEVLTIDGHAGAIYRGEAGDTQSAAAGDSTAADPSDVRIAREQLPPIAGAGERRSATVRNTCLGVWVIYFAAAFLLPDRYVYWPSIRALDSILWPAVRALGRPATAAIIAASIAVLTLVFQLLLTDNHRLRVAKQRAAALRKQAAALPPDSPRHRALIQAAKRVQGRLTAAAFVSLAALLGLMVMSFMWIPDRLDLASKNPPPGSTVYVTAGVAGDEAEPVTLTCDGQLILQEQSPASQRLPQIRPMLQQLLTSYGRGGDSDNGPAWTLSHLAANQREGEMQQQLKAFLKEPLPPMELNWSLKSPQQSGRFPITVTTAAGQSLAIAAVLGDRFAPPPREVIEAGKAPVQIVRSLGAGPIRWVKVSYQQLRVKGDDVFFTPFARLGWHWDAGYLMVYLGVYVPVFFALRTVLRIP